MIFPGLREDYKETDDMGRDRIYCELSNLLTEEDAEERYNMARRLVIRCCKRLGRYNRDRPRPFSVEFVHHDDISIMENKGNLSEGIFVNLEFSPEIERKWHTKQSTLEILMYTTRLWGVNTLLIVKTSQGR